MVCYVSESNNGGTVFSKKIACVDCGVEVIAGSQMTKRCAACRVTHNKLSARGYRAKWRLRVRGTGIVCPRCDVRVEKPGVCGKCAGYVKKWKELNVEKYRGSCKDYRDRVKEEGLLNRADGLNVGLSSGLVLKLFKEQDWKCVYCGCGISLDSSNIDHKTPTSRGGDNADWNVQMLCPTCNAEKGAKTDFEYRKTAP